MKLRKFIRMATVFAVVGSVCINVHATSISDLRQENQDAENKKAEAEEILDSLTDQQSNIMSVITELDGKVAEYNQQIVELEEKKKQLNDEIEVTKIELDDAKKEEADQHEAMKKRIQYSYENGNTNFMDTVFASVDMADMVNRSEYVEQIYKYDSNMLDSLVRIRKKVADTQIKLESDLEAVEEIEQDVSENKGAVEELLEGKQKQVQLYNSAMDDYAAQIAQLQDEIDERDAKIRQLEREAAERAAQALAAGKDVPIYYTGGNFQWPVSTGGYVSSPYGPRWGTVHQGIDIPCPIGTPILAGESGTVIASYYSASAGEYIVIDHGNGVCTEYMHNSTRLVEAGDTVSRGQVIAYSGNTGFSTGPHCHFGLRMNGVRIDPAPYL